MAATSDQADYFIFTSENGTWPSAWSWELRRKSKPMGIEISEGEFKSQQAAEFAGRRALSDFRIAWQQRRKGCPAHLASRAAAVAFRFIWYLTIAQGGGAVRRYPH